MTNFSDFSLFQDQNITSNSDPVKYEDIQLLETFRLIDEILPLESCVHNQVIPLQLVERCLILGMLNPDNQLTLDSLRTLLLSLGYSYQTKLIDAKTCQLVIADYLKYRCIPKQENINRNFEIKATDNKAKKFNPKKSNSLHDRPTLIVKQQQNYPPEISDRPQNLVDLLPTLTPEQLWKELLTRMLSGGIGRLHFERKSDRGRILWSQDGIMQSCWETSKIPVFQELIQQIKTLAKLPPSTLQKAKKIAIEKHYQNERLLLRMRLSPSQYGEEATIQVLRGAALEFYEQQQTEKITTEALELVDKLKHTLKCMRNRQKSNPSYLKVLSALEEVQNEIDPTKSNR